MKRVVIVGGGVTGLACAHFLRRLAQSADRPVQVQVLERDRRPGGRVWTESKGGFLLELGANGFLDTKRSALELCGVLGLGPALLSARPEARNRYLYLRGKLQALPTGPGQLWRSELLSLGGKLRLAAEALVPARRRPRRRGRAGQGHHAGADAEETVHAFACRRVGREAAEVLVDALVTGIQAGDPKLLSVQAAFPRMIELEQQYGSLIRALPKVRRLRQQEAAGRGQPADSAGPGGTLWSLRDGMGQLCRTLADACGRDLLTGVAVQRIRPLPAGTWRVEAEGRDCWQADAVVLACPSYAQAPILTRLDEPLAELLAGIAYSPVAVVCLGYRAEQVRRPLDGFGYLTPQRAGRHVLGVLWSSAIFDHRCPSGMALLRAMCGGWNRPDVLGWTDQQLLDAVRGELRQTMQITASPILTRIIRWPRALAQYHVGHLARVGEIERRRRRYPGLYLTGSSFRGISVNDCIEEAARCAREVLADLAEPSPAGRHQ